MLLLIHCLQVEVGPIQEKSPIVVLLNQLDWCLVFILKERDALFIEAGDEVLVKGQDPKVFVI